MVETISQPYDKVVFDTIAIYQPCLFQGYSTPYMARLRFVEWCLQVCTSIHNMLINRGGAIIKSDNWVGYGYQLSAVLYV